MRPNAIGVVAFFVVGPAAWAEAPPRLRFEPYVIRSFDGVERQAELGRLRVPARHAERASDTIELAAVRLKSTATSAGDPIVFLMGGPGIPASVMAQVPVYAQLFERLRTVADVILLDQRGTGLSRPNLECPVREVPLGPGAFESRSALLAEMLTEIRPCVATWRARGVDPAAYTSGENAADVADLRDALGANRVNLLAFSYGTEVALTVMRRHGAGVARAVLAGVRGPDHALKLPSVFDLKFRQIARLAAEGPGLTDLLRDGNDLVTRLERVLKAAQTPFRVPVTNLQTKGRVELRVGREGLQTLLTQTIDSPRLPALVVTLDQGDTRVLSRVLEPLYNSFSRGGSSLMARAINCAMGGSPARVARANAEAEWSVLGLPFDDVMISADYCQAVGQRRTGRRLVASVRQRCADPVHLGPPRQQHAPFPGGGGALRVHPRRTPGGRERCARDAAHRYCAGHGRGLLQGHRGGRTTRDRRTNRVPDRRGGSEPGLRAARVLKVISLTGRQAMRTETALAGVFRSQSPSRVSPGRPSNPLSKLMIRSTPSRSITAASTASRGDRRFQPALGVGLVGMSRSHEDTSVSSNR